MSAPDLALYITRLQLCERVPDATKSVYAGDPDIAGGGRIGENTGPFLQKKPAMPTRRELANAIRALSMDAVQKANSGHPGAPMGMADIAEVLWRDVLKFNPGNPVWWDRDRFVLSNGHASMLLYSVLYLTGYPLSMEEIKNFRQFGSKTPGHPEREAAPRASRPPPGPLGQGFANAVGMALAERSLAATFNRPGHTIIDHHTYVFMGDGCMMEGISHEAASLRGHAEARQADRGLRRQRHFDRRQGGRLVRRRHAPSASRPTAGTCCRMWTATTARPSRRRLPRRAPVTDRPSLICAKTIIGWGAPNKQGTAAMHGEAHGRRGNRRRAREPGLDVAAVRDPGRHPRRSGTCARRARGPSRSGARRFAGLQGEFPALAAELERRMAGDLPTGFDDTAARLHRAARKPKASRSRRGSPRKATLNVVGPVAAGAPRRLGRPHALERHAAQGFGDAHAASRPPATTCTTACANSACRRS